MNKLKMVLDVIVGGLATAGYMYVTGDTSIVSVIVGTLIATPVVIVIHTAL